MKTRLITAAIGVPFLIFVLIVRGWFAELVTALLTIIAMGECYRALGKADRDAAKPHYCDACFTGEYPIALPDMTDNSDRQLSLLTEMH